MSRSQKWEEIYKQTNEHTLTNDSTSRFLVFVSIGDVKNLPTTIPRTSVSTSSNGGSTSIECWMRATLCDADGVSFDDEVVESRAVPLTDVPSFGMVPIMVGDTHWIEVSIDSLEETFLKLELLYERVKSADDLSPTSPTLIGFSEVSLFVLSPMGDPLATTLHLKALRGDGSKKEVSELSAQIKLGRSSMSNEKLKQTREAFEAFDIDNSGSISSSELKSVLEHIGISCSDSQVEAMISHVDENSTGEIEIHEFINLLDSVHDSSQGLDGVIESIAKSLAFNIKDISSKYESQSHIREFKQHKRMLTLSGRRSLLHENNYVNNKALPNNLSEEAHLLSSPNTGKSSSPSYFKSRHFAMGALPPSSTTSKMTKAVAPSLASRRGSSAQDTSVAIKDASIVGRRRRRLSLVEDVGEERGGRRHTATDNLHVLNKVDNYNVNTKADCWTHQSSTRPTIGRNSNDKEDCCEELDDIANYLDQNFDRALVLIGKRHEHLVECFKMQGGNKHAQWADSLQRFGLLERVERLIRHLSSCLGHALLSLSKAAVTLYNAHQLSCPHQDAFITHHRRKVHYELFEEMKPPVLPEGLLEGVSLVKYQIVSLQQAWQHFVQQRLDRNNKFVYRLMLKEDTSASSSSSPFSSLSATTSTTTASSAIVATSVAGGRRGSAGLGSPNRPQPLIKDVAIVSDIVNHVRIAIRALITMDELVGDAAGVCEETCLILLDPRYSMDRQPTQSPRHSNEEDHLKEDHPLTHVIDLLPGSAETSSQHTGKSILSAMD